MGSSDRMDFSGGIDRAALSRNLRRAAATLAEADFISREVEERMLARLSFTRLQPASVLDLGCSGGLSLPALAHHYPNALCLGVDRESALFPAARTNPLLAASAERLPFAAESFDLVWSNLLLPWLDDPFTVFREVFRILKPGGLWLFSALGMDTLAEFCQGFADNAPHTQRFLHLYELGNGLLATGFPDPVVDREILTVTYPNLAAFLRELRAAGAGCVMANRRKTLAGRGFKARLEAHVTNLMQNHPEGRLPITFEILQGQAWKPAKVAGQPIHFLTI